eukprot:4539391-Pyramimonas_sp.AAC.1
MTSGVWELGFVFLGLPGGPRRHRWIRLAVLGRNAPRERSRRVAVLVFLCGFPTGWRKEEQ